MSRRLLRYLDWPMLVATLILVVGGAVVLYSAVQNSGDASTLVRARILHAVMGLVVLALMAFIDYHTLARAWRPILGTTLFLLVAVLIIGRSSMGAQRWIPLGPLGGFQPSELAKLAVIITLAKHLDGHKELSSWRDILPVLAQAARPIALVVRQPDLGTSMVLTAIVAVMLFAGGAPLGALGAMGPGAAVAAPMARRIPPEHQRRRPLVVTPPTPHPPVAGLAPI